MWNVSWYRISMAEGDYGVELPITFSDVVLTNSDMMKLIIKDKPNGDTIVEKDFANIAQNTINLVLTAEESALLPVGSYVYTLDWYQDGTFMCNAIPIAVFEVVDKA